MKIYVFDLDNTLYSPLIYPDCWLNNNYYAKFYNSLKKDPELSEWLKKSKNNYIFTNGNNEHMNTCLKKLRIKSLFKNTIDSNQFKGGAYKPEESVYELAIGKFNFKPDDDIFFFEDMAENLKTAKKFGWITIFLDHNNKMKNKPQYIDHKFDNIYDAIAFVHKL